MKPQHTYIVFLTNSTAFKIGITVDVKSRINNLQCANPFIKKMTVIENKNYESYLHRCLSFMRFKGEWFDIDLEEDVIIALITYLIQLREKSKNDCEAYYKWYESEYRIDENYINGDYKIKNKYELRTTKAKSYS
jgi:hypothetical protein